MKRTPSFVAILTVLALPRTAFGSESSDAVADAYCAHEQLTASSEAALLASPSVVSSAEVSALTSDAETSGVAADGTIVREPRRRLRGGLEFGIQRFVLASIRRDEGAARCHLFRAARRAEGATDQRLTAARVAGLKAKHAILEASERELASSLANSKERFRAGVAAIPELDAIAEVAASIAVARLAAKRELAEAEGALASFGTPESDDPSAEASAADASSELRRVAHSAVNARGWGLSLAAGFQSEQFLEQKLKGPYAQVSLTFNLGNVARVGDESDVVARHAAFGALDPSGSSMRAKRSVQRQAARTDELHSKSSLLDARVKELEDFLKAATSAPAGRGSEVAARLSGKLILARAEAQEAKAELKSLGPEPRSDAAKESLPLAVREATYRKSHDAGSSDKAKSASVEFVISGEAKERKKLGSGAEREQLGLMLSQVDQCNLLYVMWRRTGEIVVQTKVNPGKSTHEACGNKGYSTVKPERVASPPELVQGKRYKLSAKIEGSRITVAVDGKEVWEGTAPLTTPKGESVGFRSDNLTVDYRLEGGVFLGGDAK